VTASKPKPTRRTKTGLLSPSTEVEPPAYVGHRTKRSSSRMVTCKACQAGLT
jgi:hypothetical protein